MFSRLRMYVPDIRFRIALGCLVVAILCLLFVMNYSVLMENPRWAREEPKTRFVALQFNDIFGKHIIRRTFTASEKESVFIMGVVAKNSSRTAVWDMYSVYGQWYDDSDVADWDLRCCFMFDDGSILERNVVNYRNDMYLKGMNLAKLVLWHVNCPLPNWAPGPPVNVSVARLHSCRSDFVSFVTPYLAMRQPRGKVVINTKIAFGNLKPETVISYMEAARVLGIDKVIAYVDDSLNLGANKVLLYYASLGLLEYHKLEMADTGRVPRDFTYSDPNAFYQYVNDEWIVKRDAIERNFGADYFGIFDMDEYLIPSHNRSIKQLLNDLFSRYPRTSHVFFKNVHYLTDVTDINSYCHPFCSVFQRHKMLFPLLYNQIHEKMIMKPNKVEPHTLNNHYVASKGNFTRLTCPETDAYVRHYGSCIRKFPSKACQNTASLLRDTSMEEWARQHIEAKIRAISKRISEL